MTKTLRMQIRIDAKPERVFQALTSSEALETWFAEHADISLDDNRYIFWGKYTPGNPDREGGTQELLRVEPAKLLEFRWHFRGQETTVTFKLRKRGVTATLLTLHQTRVTDGSHDIAHYTSEDFWFLSLENLRRYLDGKSADARVDFSVPLKGDIHWDTEIDASANNVFDVLINPDQLNRWIATNAKVDPQAGGDFDLGWTGVPAFKILEISPGTSLSYEWPEDDGAGEGNIVNSTVTWTLEESGGKTRLTFVHSGFGEGADTGGIQAGWRNFINWVRSISEYGDTWQPPLIPLSPEAIAYAKSIYDGQDQLELEETT